MTKNRSSLNLNEPYLHTPIKYGVEVELMAPLGSSRKQLAETIANTINGEVKAFFHLDSEPSKVKGKPVFYHLTQAFEVIDNSGCAIAHCVDDITLQHSLDKSKKPRKGWYRIVSDDARLLRLISRHSQADEGVGQSLSHVGKLFGVKPVASKGGIYKLCDTSGASIALAAPLPGERERPCELVTTPLESDDTKTLHSLLAPAKQLKFQIPKEGATHLHFDGDFFASPELFLKTVRFLHQYRLVLRRLFGTNLNCKRLGDWPNDFLELIKSNALLGLNWEEVRLQIAQTKISKYCDFNIRNLVFNTPDKHTLEIRILPSTLDADFINRCVYLCQSIFSYLKKIESIPHNHMLEPTPENAAQLFSHLQIDSNTQQLWMTEFTQRYEKSLKIIQRKQDTLEQ